MPDHSRRRFLQYGLGMGAAIGFPVTAGRVADVGRLAVAGHTLKRFVEPLPVPGGLFIHRIFGFLRYETLTVGTTESSPQFHRQR